VAGARFGPGVVDHRTWAFVGDGCLQEGVGQETIALAGHLRLGKLVLLWDDNRITDDGSTELSISEERARALPRGRLARGGGRRPRHRGGFRRLGRGQVPTRARP
jgi:hypothetical protein